MTLNCFPITRFRFNEWGYATWRKQVQKLNHSRDASVDWNFLGFVLQDDDKPDNHLAKVSNTWSGFAMSVAWLHSSKMFCAPEIL